VKRPREWREADEDEAGPVMSEKNAPGTRKPCSPVRARFGCHAGQWRRAWRRRRRSWALGTSSSQYDECMSATCGDVQCLVSLRFAC
jgi:hypothetical protein